MTKTIPFRPKLAEGLDMDYHNQADLIRRVYNARYMGKTVHVKTSPSGRGYHIYAEEGFTVHESMMLGDCKGRIRYWERQGYTFTFNERLNWWGTTTGVEEPVNILAKPFFSKARG